MALVESCEHEKVRNFRKKDQWLWMNDSQTQDMNQEQNT